MTKNNPKNKGGESEKKVVIVNSSMFESIPIPQYFRGKKPRHPLKLEEYQIKEINKAHSKYNIGLDIDSNNTSKKIENDDNSSRLNELHSLAKPKPLYPGRRSGIDPIEFLLENYSTEIAHGALGPGVLAAFDQSLYASLSDRLLRGEPRQSLKEFFEAHRDHNLPTLADHRKMQIAQLLGIEIQKLEQFLEGKIMFSGTSRFKDRGNDNGRS